MNPTQRKHYSNMFAEFRKRWKPEWGGDTPQAPFYWSKVTHLRASYLPDDAFAKADSLEGNTHYSLEGRLVHLRKWLAENTLPRLKDLDRALAAAGGEVKSLEVRLANPGVDKSDVVEAMLRAEKRAFLRSMRPGEAMVAVSNATDPITQRAFLEAPDMSGIASGQIDQARETVLFNRDPDGAATLAEARDALELAEVTARQAQKAIRELAQFKDEKAFDEWADAELNPRANPHHLSAA